jgi:UDP-N-acetyl-2-amino-2-deoxyglucuronate dehydrogenase
MNKINTAFVGCGRVAFHHKDMIQSLSDYNVRAVCDLNENKSIDLSKEFNCKVYKNYREMLMSEDLDLLILATPTGAHYYHAIDILDTKPVNILLEKPMVLNVSHGLELHEKAESLGINIFPVYQNRFNKAVQFVKNAIEANELGEIRLATVRVRWCRPQRYYDLASWRGTYSMDGGAYVNQGIHFIDILRFLGGEVAEAISSFGRLGANPEAEDTGLSMLKFKNGAMGAIEITMSARPKDFEASVSIVGSKGIAELGGVCTNKLVKYSPDEREEVLQSEDVPISYGLGHKAIFQKIANTMLLHEPPPIGFNDGLETIKLLHTLYRSNEEQKWIKSDDNFQSFRLGEKSPELLAEYLTPKSHL